MHSLQGREQNFETLSGDREDYGKDRSLHPEVLEEMPETA